MNKQNSQFFAIKKSRFSADYIYDNNYVCKSGMAFYIFTKFLKNEYILMCCLTNPSAYLYIILILYTSYVPCQALKYADIVASRHVCYQWNIKRCPRQPLLPYQITYLCMVILFRKYPLSFSYFVKSVILAHPRLMLCTDHRSFSIVSAPKSSNKTKANCNNRFIRRKGKTEFSI